MKLGELYSKSLKEVIEGLELSNMEVHSDEDGNVKAVELRYTVKQDSKDEGNKSKYKSWP